jgi:AcrR family transcriptional regulator
LNELDQVRNRLPRGRHKMPRAEVEANQRRRLLAAATDVLAERGYTALTVDQVIEGAGVSRATFYEQFTDKHECVLAAHAAAFEHLLEAIRSACGVEAGWADGVAAGIGAGLEFAEAAPHEARLVVETYPAASDPQLAEHGLLTHEQLASLLRAGRPQGLGEGPAEETTERAVIGAAISIVGARLFEDEAEHLVELRPELVELVLAPYLGDSEARQVARSGARGKDLEECGAP